MASQNQDLKEGNPNAEESFDGDEAPAEETPEAGEGREATPEAGEESEEAAGEAAEEEPSGEEVEVPEVTLPDWLSTIPAGTPTPQPQVPVQPAPEPSELLTPAEAAELYTDPAKVLNIALTRLGQQMTNQLQQAEVQRQNVDQVEVAFFEAYPELSAHKTFVRAIARELATGFLPQMPLKDRLQKLASVSYQQLAPLIARDRKASGVKPKVKATKTESGSVRGPGGPAKPDNTMQGQIRDLFPD